MNRPSTPSEAKGSTSWFSEHLEGQTLATRLEIERGPLPLEEALQIAIDVADALAAAHREDIIHRGLTPSRIMLTTEGVARQSSPQAKILDFGLAAVRSSAAATASDVSDVADVADVAMTQTEVAPLISTGGTADLDTLRYSAPEQIDGREASAATDLFSLGAILHEMLTGSRAFEGDSQAAVVGAVLERDPPSVSTLAAGVPPALDRLIKKCLTKDPRRPLAERAGPPR